MKRQAAIRPKRQAGASAAHFRFRKSRAARVMALPPGQGILLTSVATMSSTLAVSAAETEAESLREFYELRLYHLRQGPMLKRFDEFFFWLIFLANNANHLIEIKEAGDKPFNNFQAALDGF